MQNQSVKVLLITVALSLFSVMTSAKSWPSNSMSLLKNVTIYECQFFSMMIGRDISNEYNTKLLSSYKKAYPDYADFERFSIRVNGGIDDIRLKQMLSYANKCTFEGVWLILEKGSPCLTQLESGQYAKLKKLTIIELRKEFSSVGNFVRQLVTNWSATDNTLKRIVSKVTSHI